MPGTAGAATAASEALRLLRGLGWRYVDRGTVAQWRGSLRTLLLKQRLIDVLQTRRFDYKGQSYPLSPNGIEQVVREHPDWTLRIYGSFDSGTMER